MAIKPAIRIKTKITLITVIALLLISFLVGLGSWQIQRYGWKQDLIARVEQNIHAAPLKAPESGEWAVADKKVLEYRAVEVNGQYLNTQEIQVGALTEKGSGYWILTPFQRDNGEILFVNRGYVVTAKRDPASRASGQIEGETVVTGLLRLTEPKGFFLRQNKPEQNIWYSRDTQAFAENLGLRNVLPYFVDADASQNRIDRPIGGMTVVKFADNHLAYAFTWFSLALMLLGMTIYLIYYEIRRKRKSDQASE